VTRRVLAAVNDVANLMYLTPAYGTRRAAAARESLLIGEEQSRASVRLNTVAPLRRAECDETNLF